MFGRQAGRGRGRGATLPAWMTAGDAVPGIAAAGGHTMNGANHENSPQNELSPRAAPVHSSPRLSSAPDPVHHSAHLQRFNDRSTTAASAAPASMAPTPAPAPAPEAPATWTVVKDSSNREYYVNTATNETTYEKPEALMSAAERALPRCPWQEFVAQSGKKYYYNSNTKESVWTEPEELTRYNEQLAQLEAQMSGQAPSPAAQQHQHAPGMPPAQHAASQGRPGQPMFNNQHQHQHQHHPQQQPNPYRHANPYHPQQQQQHPRPYGGGGPVGYPTSHGHPGGYNPGFNGGGYPGQGPPRGPGGPMPYGAPMGHQPGFVPPYGMQQPNPYVAPRPAAPAPIVQGEAARALASGEKPASEAAAAAMAAAMAASANKDNDSDDDASMPNLGVSETVSKPAAASSSTTAAAGTSTTTSDARASSAPTASQQEPATSRKQHAKYASHEEAEAAFKNLLEEKGVTSVMKWQDAMKLVIDDPRWTALRTVGQKKQAFTEYASQRQKREREQARQRRLQAREDFTALLRGRDDFDSEMTWRLASKLLDDDPAFQAVEDDQERFELFEEWRRELHEREEKERAAKRQADMDRVLVYLRSREDIIASTMWSDIKDSLVDNDDFDSVDRTIILDAFKQHMLDLEEAHRQYVEQKRADRAKAERQRRDDFRDCVLRNTILAKFRLRNRWRDAEPSFRGSDDLEGLSEFPTLKPRDIFASATDDVYRLVKRFRESLGAACEARMLAPITADSTLAEYCEDVKAKALVTDEDLEPVMAWATQSLAADQGEHLVAKLRQHITDIASKREIMPLTEMLKECPETLVIHFRDSQMYAKEAEEAEQKRLVEIKERYNELLTDYYYRTDHLEISWEEACEDMEHRSAFKALPPYMRELMFEEHMNVLREAAGIELKDLKDTKLRHKELKAQDAADREAAAADNNDKDKDKDKSDAKRERSSSRHKEGHSRKERGRSSSKHRDSSASKRKRSTSSERRSKRR